MAYKAYMARLSASRFQAAERQSSLFERTLERVSAEQDHADAALMRCIARRAVGRSAVDVIRGWLS